MVKLKKTFTFYSGEGNSFKSLSLLAGSPEFPAKSQLFYYNLKDSFVYHPEFNLSSPQHDLAILEVNMSHYVIDNSRDSQSLSVGLSRYDCTMYNMYHHCLCDTLRFETLKL